MMMTRLWFWGGGFSAALAGYLAIGPRGILVFYFSYIALNALAYSLGIAK